MIMNGFNKIIKIKISKKSSRINYMIGTVAESLNCTMNMNEDSKKEIKK